MIPFLSLLSNPITKLVADKVIGGVKHSMEKKQMVREAEIEAIKQTDFAKIKKEEAIAKADAAVRKAQADGMSKSFKDEFLVIFWCAVIAATFFEPTQPHMIKGWEVLKQAPTEVWYVILTITAGSFGANTIAKWKK
jgi:hypothetical protein